MTRGASLRSGGCQREVTAQAMTVGGSAPSGGVIERLCLGVAFLAKIFSAVARETSRSVQPDGQCVAFQSPEFGMILWFFLLMTGGALGFRMTDGAIGIGFESESPDQLAVIFFSGEIVKGGFCFRGAAVVVTIFAFHPFGKDRVFKGGRDFFAGLVSKQNRNQKEEGVFF